MKTKMIEVESVGKMKNVKAAIMFLVITLAVTILPVAVEELMSVPDGNWFELVKWSVVFLLGLLGILALLLVYNRLWHVDGKDDPPTEDEEE